MTGDTLAVVAQIRWRPTRPWRLRCWSGTLSYRLLSPEGEPESLSIEPAWDGLYPVRWRAFSRQGLRHKLRRYAARQGRIATWAEERA